MTKGGHARHIMTVLISSVSTDKTLKTNRERNGKNVRLIRVTKATSSRALDWGMASALASKQERQSRATAHFLLGNGMIWQSADSMWNQCLRLAKWWKRMQDTEVMKQSENQKTGGVEVKREQRKELLVDMKQWMEGWRTSDVYDINSGTTDMSTSIISTRQLWQLNWW